MYAQHARDHNVIIYTEDRGRASERAKKVAREASYWLFGGYVIALPTLYERLGLHGVPFGIPNAQANQMNCVSSLRMPKQLESPLTDFVQQICLDVYCLSDSHRFLLSAVLKSMRFSLAESFLLQEILSRLICDLYSITTRMGKSVLSSSSMG